MEPVRSQRHCKIASLLILCMAMTAILSSCTRKEENRVSIGELELPDYTMQQASYTIGKPGELPLVMNAELLTVWQDGRIELEDVSFSQLSADGSAYESTIEGSCDRVLITDKQSSALLEGNVVIDRKDDEISIETQSIMWDNGKRLLKSDGEVLVSYSDGISIQARGFSAMLDSSVCEFLEIIEGRIQ